ncbi:hypothetical protein ACSSS7_003445 [Eimeria intestinalis]
MGSGGRKQTIKARALLVDMEEGVVHRLLRGPLSSLFDSTLLITDVSGAGNNWAYGHEVYGQLHGQAIADKVARAMEMCDSPQAAHRMHTTEELQPFAHVNNLVARMLAHLTRSVALWIAHADKKGTATLPAIPLVVRLRSSVRFGGPLDVDLLDLSSNLVPYRGLHFVSSALSSLRVDFAHQQASRVRTRRVKASECAERTPTCSELLLEALGQNSQLLDVCPKNGLYALKT